MINIRYDIFPFILFHSTTYDPFCSIGTKDIAAT